MHVVRDGAIESVHTGHLTITDPSGGVLLTHGDDRAITYPRSAVKPFQAVAVLEMLPLRPPVDEIAIMAASHVGGAAHLAAVVRVLDRARVNAGALRCPPALPVERAALVRAPGPTRLAHNCSGKHAGFLLATAAADADRTRYLDPDAPVQVAARAVLADVTDSEPAGPGVDGCGAPAWRLPLPALAVGFARLAAATDRAITPRRGAHPSPAGAAAARAAELAAVADAMRTHPLLVGGDGIVDSELMGAASGLVAKRGAEGTLAIAAPAARGPLGIAIKVADGASRPLGPVAVAVLDRLGIAAPPALRHPPVLGGGTPHGTLRPAPELDRALSALE